MKKNLKYKPVKQFTIANDGFHGSWYKPETDRFPEKAMIVLGGAAGSFLLTQMWRKDFAGRE